MRGGLAAARELPVERLGQFTSVWLGQETVLGAHGGRISLGTRIGRQDPEQVNDEGKR